MSIFSLWKTVTEPSEEQTKLDEMIAKLVSSLHNHPEDWTAERMTLKHTPSGIELWRGNGWSFCGTFRPHDLTGSTLSVLQRRRLWKAMQALKVVHTVTLLEAEKVIDQLDKSD
ncbi:MAG: hypothetical protein QQN63_08685, partial [Nitrosopumilus sp.]